MGAFVNHEFEKGFFLDEERLRKINDILVTRGISNPADDKATYKVYRSDAFTYSTDNLQEILSEDNAEWKKIVRITALLKNSDFSLELDFDSPKTTLHIEGEERDKVFLLFSELRQYLSNEVNIFTKRVLKSQHIRLFSLMLMLVLFIYALSRFSSLNPNDISIETALASDDVSLKLNYLLEKYDSSSLSKTTPLFYGLILFMIISTFDEQIAKMILRPFNYLFPSHVFLFGKEVDRHAKRLTLRQNLLWGVIISSFISLLTGFAIWMITK